MRPWAASGVAVAAALAFGVCGWAAPAAAQEPDGAPSASAAPAPAHIIDAAHLARIDRLLEAVEYGAMIDAMSAEVRGRGDSGGDKASVEDAEVAGALLEYTSWRNTADRWRRALAASLTPEQADAIIAYYRSPSGRALTACLKSYLVDMSPCGLSLSDEHRLANLEFNLSPAGETWRALDRRLPPVVMTAAICDGLEREPAMLSRMRDVCRRDPDKGFCELVKTGQGGGGELDRIACSVAGGAGESPPSPEQIERLIEASGLPAMIDSLAEAPSLPDTFSRQERTLLQQFASYAAWRNSGDLWRAELRQRLNAGQAEAIIAYYRTAAGQQIAACLAAEPEHWGLRICESTLPDTLRPVSDAFNASDAGRAWALIGDQRPVPVLSQATCDGLRREPEVLRSLAKLCRRDREYDPCIFVDDADGTPRIDSAACAGNAPRPE